jgi:predicted nucleic acid-binding protein
MTRSGFLVDTSAFVRLLKDQGLRAEWRDIAGAGALAICPITEMELMYSAVSKEHWQSLQSVFRQSYVWVVMSDRTYLRAQSVQEGLLDRGTHRSAGPIDLLVAATARLTDSRCSTTTMTLCRWRR